MLVAVWVRKDGGRIGLDCPPVPPIQPICCSSGTLHDRSDIATKPATHARPGHLNGLTSPVYESIIGTATSAAAYGPIMRWLENK